jgi:hypothetical protein
VTCLNQKSHANDFKLGYVGWFLWARKKARRHQQVQCLSCGQWAIWKRRAKDEADYGGRPELYDL